MTIEKNLDQYIGDVVGGLIREAAAMKAHCIFLETTNTGLQDQIIKLKQKLKDAGLLSDPEYYID